MAIKIGGVTVIDDSQNITSTGTISATGNITAGNIIGTIAGGSSNIAGGNIATTGTVSATGNVRGGNVNSSGIVSATGNIVGNYILGNGVSLTGVITSVANINNGTSNVTVTSSGGNVTTGIGGTANVVVVASTGQYVTGVESVTGNITGGNIGTSGTVTAASTVGGVITGSNVSVTGDVQGSSASLSGTVTAAYTQGGSITGTNISVTGNVAGDNASVTGAIISASVEGGVITGSSASVTGNVTGASLIGTIATPNQSSITTIGTLSSLNVSGNVSASGLSIPTGNATIGNLYVSGVTTIAGNIQQISGNSGQFFGNATTGFNALYAGLPAGFTLLPSSIVNFVSNYNNYNQVNLQNQNGGDLATADFIITGNNGDDANYFMDVGFAGSGYDGNVGIANNALGNALLANDGYIYVHGNTTNHSSNFLLAAPDANAQVKFAIGGSTASNIAVKMNPPNTDATNGTSGTLVVSGGVGVAGNIFASGDVSVSGNHSLIGQLSATGNIIGNSKLLIGSVGTTLTNPVAVFTGSGTDFAQLAMNNPITTGSSDLAAYGNNGDDTQSWMDMGFTGNAFSDSNYTITSAGDGYLFAQGNVGFGGNMVIATGTTGTTRDIIFGFGFQTANEFLRFQRSTNTVLPYANTTANIGSSTKYFNNVYASAHNGTTVSVTGNVTAGGYVGTVYTNSIVNTGANSTGNIGSSATYFNTVFAKATSAQYADLAEKYTADADYAPGTVVVFGGTHEVTVNAADGDRKVAGVVSTNPSYIMNSGLESDHVATVALTGRVPTFVIGPVKKGDLMVAAGLGRARAEADPRVGTVIGKALEDFNGAEGTIEVVVGRF